jgi:hypothetical protein
VFGWTTEFWDIVHAATGTKVSTKSWYIGATDEQSLAVLQWLDEQERSHHFSGEQRTMGFVDWYDFDHPQLGMVELGGWNDLYSWTNPPLHLLREEVDSHCEFAVHQALAAPCIEIKHTSVEALGQDTWRVTVGVANTGWLPTYVTEKAKKDNIVRSAAVELAGGDVIDGPARREIGQLAGSISARFNQGGGGSPERALAAWTVRATRGTELRITASHQRAGTKTATLVLD